jgi:protein-S-isoprenylcysteine O-methyltransferase Ste14
MQATPASSLTVTDRPSLLLRVGVMAYGVLVYLLSVATLAYTIAFVLDSSIAPLTVSKGPIRPLETAIMGNAALLTIFALQHSVMARPAFKAWLTRLIPEPAERSTYCLATCAALAGLFAFWSPIEGTVWQITTPWVANALVGFASLGFVYLLVASFQLDHFALFGLRQPWAFLRGRPLPDPTFRKPPLYRLSRHPIYLGMLVGMWSAPTMSYGHLFFACLATGYILVGSSLEERDLARTLGTPYSDYQVSVSRLIPLSLFKR